MGGRVEFYAERSLARAARKANCSKSTILRRLRALEKEKNVVLLHPVPYGKQALWIDTEQLEKISA